MSGLWRVGAGPEVTVQIMSKAGRPVGGTAAFVPFGGTILNRLAAEFAAEISNHDWSDSPYRLDRAGHDRKTDTHASSQKLSDNEAVTVQANVVFVTAQVLMFSDPNLNIHEYATACGLPGGLTHTKSGRPSGAMDAGIRRSCGQVTVPGTWTV